MTRFLKYTILIIVFGLLVAASLLGCESINIPLTARNIGSNQEVELGVESKPPPKQSAPPAFVIPDILPLSAPGTAVEGNDKARIDFSNASDGYIMARYLEVTDKKVKLLLTIPDETQYTYTLEPGADYEAFPLSGGNGEYTIAVFEQIEGTRYVMVATVTIEVALVDEFVPFLRANQYVNFNRDSNVVRKGAELTAGLDDLMDKIAAIYNYVITNIDYDVLLAETVQSGYLPDLDLILERGMGICFDYAALMVAMLRSQGIPTKLVIGYTGEAYHAWISVYSEDTGWIDNIIFFDGISWNHMDPTFAASGQTAEIMQYIGDGENYHPKFFH